MASALAVMKRMDLDFKPGVGGVLLDTGIGAATSYGIGQLYHRFGEGWGRQVPKALAIGGKLGAVGLTMMGHGGFACAALNSVGQAGVNAYFLELGLKHAREKTGKQVVMLPAGASAPAGSKQLTSVAGKALSFDQIEELARMS